MQAKRWGSCSPESGRRTHLITLAIPVTAPDDGGLISKRWASDRFHSLKEPGDESHCPLFAFLSIHAEYFLETNDERQFWGFTNFDIVAIESFIQPFLLVIGFIDGFILDFIQPLAISGDCRDG